jgi:hypothetical protein
MCIVAGEPCARARCKSCCVGVSARCKKGKCVCERGKRQLGQVGLGVHKDRHEHPLRHNVCCRCVYSDLTKSYAHSQGL